MLFSGLNGSRSRTSSVTGWCPSIKRWDQIKKIPVFTQESFFKTLYTVNYQMTLCLCRSLSCLPKPRPSRRVSKSWVSTTNLVIFLTFILYIKNFFLFLLNKQRAVTWKEKSDSNRRPLHFCNALTSWAIPLIIGTAYAVLVLFFTLLNIVNCFILVNP